ncbi:hypothetical protein D3C79_603130 [compost metagenome]
MVRLAVSLPVAVCVEAVVEALGGADAQRMSALALADTRHKVLAGGQHRSQDFFPGRPLAVRPFVHQDEEQAGAAQVVVVLQAHAADQVAALERDQHVRFVRLALTPHARDSLLQSAPENPASLFLRWGRVPDLILYADAPLRSQTSCAAHLCLAEECLAEPPTTDRIPEARITLEAPDVDVRLLGRQLDRRLIGTG